jgi:hypothetical protein
MISLGESRGFAHGEIGRGALSQGGQEIREVTLFSRGD